MNVISKLRNALQLWGRTETIGGVSLTVLFKNVDGNLVLGYGATVAADGQAGFAKGCFFIKTGGGIGTTIYVNEGSSTACDFNVGSVGGGDITKITAGSALTGGGDSGDITLDVAVDDSTIEINADALRVKDGGITPAKTNIVQSVTATDTGATTGTILATTRHATVTSAAANKQVILPAPTVGRQVVINVGANGFDLKTSDPATVALNGGTGAGAKSAIAADSTVLAFCISATAWKAIYLDADGDVAKVTPAA